VSDRIPWACGQVEKRFGSQEHYLVVFYHVCEYLEDSESLCSGKSEKGSRAERQKEFMKRDRRKKRFNRTLMEENGGKDKKKPADQ
jgi:hypothetical protein